MPHWPQRMSTRPGYTRLVAAPGRGERRVKACLLGRRGGDEQEKRDQGKKAEDRRMGRSVPSDVSRQQRKERPSRTSGSDRAMMVERNKTSAVFGNPSAGRRPAQLSRSARRSPSASGAVR